MIKAQNVLSGSMFEAIQQTAGQSYYEPVTRLDETAIYIAQAPRFFTKQLNAAIQEELGEFDTIINYFRYNSPDTDTKQRIHSDGLILEQQPTHGVVFYISAQEGTSFYSHDKWGKFLPKGEVMDETEYGKDVWTKHHTYEAENNSMIMYPSNVFHQRSEAKASSDRFVWVSFVKVKE